MVEWEESLGRMSARIATVVLWRTTFGGYRGDTETATTERRSIAVGSVRYVEANTKGERPTGYWLCSSAPMPMKQRFFKRTRHHKGYEKLINTLRLLANQLTDGDSPIHSIVTGLHERTRIGITDGLRSFIEIDNHSAVDVGHLSRSSRPFHVQKPSFTEDYADVIREGANGLTLRAEEVKTVKACIKVDHIEENRRGPPLVAADWYAFCQANLQRN